MQHSRLSIKGQITVPKEIRRIPGVKAGDIVAYEVLNGGVIPFPSRRDCNKVAKSIRLYLFSSSSTLPA